MPTIDIKIPQLGEGLHEARLLRFLKQPGEAVAQDEPIYEMETDKAVMEIESPAAGVLESWSASEDDVLPIGATIGRIATELTADKETRRQGDKETADGATGRQGDRATAEPNDPTTQRPNDLPTQHPTPNARELLRNLFVPPRTKAYAREKGLSDAELAMLAQSADGKLMPASIDRYLEMRARPSLHDLFADAAKLTDEPEQAPATEPSTLNRQPSTAYEDTPLPQRQRTLVYRMQRGTQQVVPATMDMPVDWSAVEAVRAQFRSAGGDPNRQPTQFLLFAWCVAQSARNHPAFRAALVNDSTLRQYAHLHLGIAVARENDELLMARVQDADGLGFEAFIAAAQETIGKAREGIDQAAEAMQLSLTNMAGAGVRSGIPIVLAPAVGTLFIGAPYDEAYPIAGGGVGFRRLANMVLSFDHRLVNGIGAANFLLEVKRRVEGLREEFPAK